MIDQYHVRETIDRYRKGLECFGQNPDDIHWQSFAVLLCHAKDPTSLWKRLMEPGWFKDGIRWADNDMCDYGVSMYLSPKGMPYYVNYAGHAALYADLFDTSQNALNRAGWLHISDDRVDHEVQMTQAQKDWLQANKPSMRKEPMGYQWHINRVNWDADKVAPTPLPCVEKFDVRPSEDWDRLMMRIERAVKPVETALPVMAINVPPMYQTSL